MKTLNQEWVLGIKGHTSKGVQGTVLAESKLKTQGGLHFVIFQSEYHTDGQYDLLYYNTYEQLWKSTNLTEDYGSIEAYREEEYNPKNCLDWIKQHDPNLEKYKSMWDIEPKDDDILE